MIDLMTRIAAAEAQQKRLAVDAANLRKREDDHIAALDAALERNRQWQAEYDRKYGRA